MKYVKERKQFDKPIGSLQAIQHKLVGLFTEAEGLKVIIRQAAWRINENNPPRRRDRP